MWNFFFAQMTNTALFDVQTSGVEERPIRIRLAHRQNDSRLYHEREKHSTSNGTQRVRLCRRQSAHAHERPRFVHIRCQEWGGKWWHTLRACGISRARRRISITHRALPQSGRDQRLPRSQIALSNRWHDCRHELAICYWRFVHTQFDPLEEKSRNDH